jgi:hypothetical protein
MKGLRMAIAALGVLSSGAEAIQYRVAEVPHFTTYVESHATGSPQIA